MENQTLTIIFWNIWAYAQSGKYSDGNGIINRLGQSINEFDPDIFGLNEVLVKQQDNSSVVIEFLQSRGYFCHFTLISPTDDVWFVGNLAAFKNKPVIVSEHVIGPDTQASRRGYHDYSVKIIEAEVMLYNTSVTIVLNYFSSLLPADWRTHATHRKSYEKIIRNITNNNLVIGGDFNETKYMLPWLRLPRPLKRKTGSLLNPTWRLNGKVTHLVFANYDNIVYSEAGGLHLKTFKVLPRQPSDHAPLLGIFSITSSEKHI